MKVNSTLLKCLVAVLIFAAPLTLLATTSYKGRVVYYNANKTPMKGVEILLKNQEGNVVATQYTDEKGNYSFTGLAESVYILDANYDAEPGGIDMTDLYLILQHLMGVKQLKGISYIASDVDGSGVVDWNDFWDFLVGWFVKGEAFKAGKWAFQSRTIDLSNAELKVVGDDYLLGTGDGDGGYEPGVKNNPVGAELSYKGSIPVSTDNYYEIPIYYAGQESLGGMSLVINYPADVYVEGVTSQIENLNYSFDKGSLKISWLNTNIGMSVIDNTAPLFTIKTRMANEVNGKNIFSLASQSQLINLEGAILSKASMTMPLIEGEMEKPELKNIYPNPVRDHAKIEYKLNEVSDVTLSIFNTSGQKLAELVKAVQSAGDYQIKLDVNNLNLSSGMYIYRLDCSGDQMYTESKILIVSK